MSRTLSRIRTKNHTQIKINAFKMARGFALQTPVAVPNQEMEGIMKRTPKPCLLFGRRKKNLRGSLRIVLMMLQVIYLLVKVYFLLWAPA